MRRFAPIVALLGVAGAYLGYRLYLSRQPYEWSGTLEVRTIDIGSRAGGRVKQVLAHEGEAVTAGQKLVVLEAPDLVAQRLAAEGQLMQAQAALEKLQKGARPEEIEQARARAQSSVAALEQTRAGSRREQVAAAEERLAAAQATLDKAQLDADRVHKLLLGNVVAQAEADAADAALRSARAQRNAQARTVDDLRAGARDEEIKQAAARNREMQASAALVVAGARAEDKKAAEGAVKAAQGRLDQFDAMLAELTITAPVAAVVETLDLRPGDLVAPGAPAGRLVEKGQLFARIYVPETELGHVRVGQKLQVSVDSFPDRGFPGVVEWISAIGEYSPRNLQTADERADEVFAMRIGLPEGDGALKAGMSALVRVARP